jgi:Integrase zinc binding domain/Integrase core domain
MEGKIVISVSMRPFILTLVHEGHQGIEKSKAFARTAVWWPGISRMIESVVSACATCCSNRSKQPAEPLLPHAVPDYPWQKIGADIFTFNRKDFLLVVDYFSKFPIVVRLEDKAASTVSAALKSLFSIYGTPMTLFSDNMPFGAQQMRNFASKWNFDIVTSSPGFPQSNGQAERAIQTVKSFFKKSEISGDDPLLALMNYRATPLTGASKSPAELFLNRQIRTKLPVAVSKLIPEQSVSARDQLVDRQQRHKITHDRHAKDLKPLQPGDVVRVRQDDRLTHGIVTARHPSPRSYIVDTETGATLRRNRRHLFATKEAAPDTRPDMPDVTPDSTINSELLPVLPTDGGTKPNNSNSGILRQTVTSSGRPVRPPVRFRDFVTS